MHIPIIYSNEYIINLEPVNLNNTLVVFIHANVSKWNTRTYKELKQKWNEFRTHYRDEIWALPSKENTVKFAKLFGFKHRGNYMRHVV